MKLTEERIFEIAEECHISNKAPLRLTDMGDGTMRFLEPKELTIFGRQLLTFAKAIEKEVSQ